MATAGTVGAVTENFKSCKTWRGGMGSAICSCLLALGRNNSMAGLREAHLRYLLATYELGKSTPDVGTQAVAKALNCSKASVTKMLATLMDINLLVRERHGKST